MFLSGLFKVHTCRAPCTCRESVATQHYMYNDMYMRTCSAGEYIYVTPGRCTELEDRISFFAAVHVLSSFGGLAQVNNLRWPHAVQFASDQFLACGVFELYFRFKGRLQSPNKLVRHVGVVEASTITMGFPIILLTRNRVRYHRNLAKNESWLYWHLQWYHFDN